MTATSIRSLIADFQKDILSDEDLNNVLSWKYSVEDKSVTTQYLTPYWQAVLNCVPKSVAPNVLTLMGFFCVLEAVRSVSLHWDLSPSWTAGYAVVLLFAYQTL